MNQQTSSQQKVTQKVSNTANASKKKFQHIWKVALVTVSLLVSIVGKKVFVFQTHQYFKDIRLGNAWELSTYGLLFAVIFSIFDWTVHKVFDDICEKYYLNWEKYPTQEQRKKRSYTLVKWGYCIVYYFSSSVWCYFLLKDTSFLPTWMGGKGDPFEFFLRNAPLGEATFGMKFFYIFQFGKHFSRFFVHVFIRPQGSFFEYALHHGLSVFLIAFSFLTNLWWIGIMVLMVHDYSDFGLILARIYRDYKYLNKRVLDVLYVHAFVFWIGCRHILFNITCIFPAIYTIINGFPNYDEFQRSIMEYPYMLMTAMMIMLEVQHFYWTYFIAQSFISVKVTTTVRHSYD